MVAYYFDYAVKARVRNAHRVDYDLECGVRIEASGTKTVVWRGLRADDGAPVGPWTDDRAAAWADAHPTPLAIEGE